MREGCKYNLTQIGLRGTEALRNEIKEHARAQGISVNDYILKAVESQINYDDSGVVTIAIVYKKPNEVKEFTKLEESPSLSSAMTQEYNELVDLFKTNYNEAQLRLYDDMRYLANFISSKTKNI